ncbi:MAG: hypothetical protein WCF44_09600 [Candidatus Methylophosphatis roskildensis]
MERHKTAYPCSFQPTRRIDFSALFAELAAAHIALASVALCAVFFVPAPWRRVAK